MMSALVAGMPSEATATKVQEPAVECGNYCDNRDPALPPSAQRSPYQPGGTSTPTRPTGGPPSTGVPAPAPTATICNKYCDARDPALAPADRLAQTVAVGGRQISLHFDDTDA